MTRAGSEVRPIRILNCVLHFMLSVANNIDLKKKRLFLLPYLLQPLVEAVASDYRRFSISYFAVLIKILFNKASSGFFSQY